MSTASAPSWESSSGAAGREPRFPETVFALDPAHLPTRRLSPACRQGQERRRLRSAIPGSSDGPSGSSFHPGASRRPTCVGGAALHPVGAPRFGAVLVLAPSMRTGSVEEAFVFVSPGRIPVWWNRLGRRKGEFPAGSVGGPTARRPGIDLAQFVAEVVEDLPLGVERPDLSGDAFAVLDGHGPNHRLDQRDLGRDQ